MSVISGIAGAVASSNASDAQVKASEKAVEAQLQMYNQSRADQYPWRTAGTAALNKMSGLMGMGYIPADTGATSYGGQGTNALAGYYQPGAVTTGSGYQANALGSGMTAEQIYNQLMAEAQQTGDTSKVSQFIAAYNASGVANQTTDMGGPFPQSPGTTAADRWAQQYLGGSQQVVPSTSTNALYPSGMSSDQARANEMQSFYTSPGYEFRLGEGLKAIDRGAAARGGLQSGAAIKAEQRYGEGLAASEYGDYWNRLAAMSGVGQTSVQSTGQLGANTANQIGQAYTNAGNARASGYINQANALSGASNSAVNALVYYNAMNKVGGGNTPNYGAMAAVQPSGASNWWDMGGGY